MMVRRAWLSHGVDIAETRRVLAVRLDAFEVRYLAAAVVALNDVEVAERYRCTLLAEVNPATALASLEAAGLVTHDGRATALAEVWFEFVFNRSA